jgi:hypothetical protein
MFLSKLLTPTSVDGIDFEWVFVSGDDTYLYVDSLRRFLQSIKVDRNVPVFIGQVPRRYRRKQSIYCNVYLCDRAGSGMQDSRLLMVVLVTY